MPRKRDAADRAAVGRFAYDGLDRVLHEKARLGILTSLVANPDGLKFNELRTLCTLTDGNLSRHLKALEEANLIRMEKGSEEKRPRTVCHVTNEGRERFLAYLHELEAVVADAAEAAKKPADGDARPGCEPVGL